MNEHKIEKMDRKRYRVMVWRAIGMFLFLGGVLARMLMPGEPHFWFDALMFLYGTGCALTIVMSAQFTVLSGIIKRDPDLNAALNNELFVHYFDRSIRWGFYAMVAAALVLYFVIAALDVEITGKIVCMALLFCGAVTQMLSEVIYNRQ